jgi:hypothetical protein
MRLNRFPIFRGSEIDFWQRDKSKIAKGAIKDGKEKHLRERSYTGG